MKILAVSNYFPPYHFGGYELGCQDVVERLRSRGHDVRVLTSTYGTGTRREGHVERALCDDSAWEPTGYYRTIARLVRKEWINQRAFSTLVDAFRPDVVYVWNPTGISLSAAAQATVRGIPVAYFVSDDWLAFPQPAADRWFGGWIGNGQDSRRARPHVRAAVQRLGLMTAPPQWCYEAVHFASQFLKDQATCAGRPIGRTCVIHWGVDLARHPYKEEPSKRPRRLLYAGQVVRHKGVMTAVLATHILRQIPEHAAVTLDIVGGSRQPSFVAELRDRVRELGLGDAVRLSGPLPREDLPAVYRAADVLVFPSEWPEPFAITPLEAMASGLPLAATRTGGTAEMLEPEVNALIFEPGDARACAQQVQRLLEQPALYDAVRCAARKAVEDRFRIEYTVDRIEAALGAQVAR